MKRFPISNTVCHFGLFALASLVTAPGAGYSQPQIDQIPPAPGRALFKLCAAGFFEDAIAKANTWIDKPAGGEAAPILYYWRGRAEFRIGQYDQAQSDLEKVAATGMAVNGNASAAQTLEQIKAIKALLPPQTIDIKDPQDDKITLFHVYYMTKNAMTQSILDALPLAYRIDAKMLSRNARNQTAVIFDTAEHMAAFKKLRGQKVTNWASAYADATGIYFCLQTPTGQLLTRSEERIQATTTHEFNHALLRRMMGVVKNPTWFVEGLAVYAQSKVQKDATQLNDQRIKQIAQAGLLLPLAKIETHASFVELTEESVDNRRNGKGQMQPSGYVQGFSMTRYLLTKIPEEQLPQFLQSVREQQSFEAALQAEIGLTLPQFYDAWRKDTLARLGVADQLQNADTPKADAPKADVPKVDAPKTTGVNETARNPALPALPQTP